MLVMETHNDFVRFHGAPVQMCPPYRSIKIVARSVSVGITYDPSYSSENPRINLATPLYLAYASYRASPFFHSIHVVRPPWVLVTLH